MIATIQISERAKLIKACGKVQPMIVDVSPNKENISFNFILVIEKEAVTWWLQRGKGKETPQTTIFCNTFNDISTVLTYLLLILKEKAFTKDSDCKKLSSLSLSRKILGLSKSGYRGRFQMRWDQENCHCHLCTWHGHTFPKSTVCRPVCPTN